MSFSACASEAKFCYDWSAEIWVNIGFLAEQLPIDLRNPNEETKARPVGSIFECIDITNNDIEIYDSRVITLQQAIIIIILYAHICIPNVMEARYGFEPESYCMTVYLFMHAAIATLLKPIVLD